MLENKKIAVYIDVENTELSYDEFVHSILEIETLGEIISARLYNVFERKHKDILEEIVNRGFDLTPSIFKKKHSFDNRMLVDIMEDVLQNTNIEAVAIIAPPADMVYLYRRLKSFNVEIFALDNNDEQSSSLVSEFLDIGRVERLKPLPKEKAKKPSKKAQKINETATNGEQNDVALSDDEAATPMTDKQPIESVEATATVLNADEADKITAEENGEASPNGDADESLVADNELSIEALAEAIHEETPYEFNPEQNVNEPNEKLEADKAEVIVQNKDNINAESEPIDAAKSEDNHAEAEKAENDNAASEQATESNSLETEERQQATESAENVEQKDEPSSIGGEPTQAENTLENIESVDKKANEETSKPAKNEKIAIPENLQEETPIDDENTELLEEIKKLLAEFKNE